MSVQKKYPLDSEEVWTLSLNLLFTQVGTLVIGLVGAVLVSGFATGDWGRTVLGWGWVTNLSQSWRALPAAQTLAVGVVTAVVLYLLAWGVERRSMSTEGGRASVQKTRRGIDGELPRLSLAAILLLMTLTGCAEELLFRYVLLTGIFMLLNLAIPSALATALALVISSFVFWIIHARFRNLWAMRLTLVLGLGFGIAFLATGSLAAAAFAHTAYNIIELLLERREMRRDADYFGGPAPSRVMLDMLDEEEFEEMMKNADAANPSKQIKY